MTPATNRSLVEGSASPRVRWAELMVPSFEEIRGHRPIAQPLIVGWVLALCTAWLTVPLVDLAMAGGADGAAPVVRGWMWAMVALAPLVQSGRALLWAAASWALLALASRNGSWRGLFSVFLYGEVLTAAYGLLLALFFQWSVDPGAQGVAFVDPLSLGAYVPSSHGPLAGLVKHLSLIQVGWVAYVGFAARRALGLRPRGAALLALALWVGMVGISTIRLLTNG